MKKGLLLLLILGAFSLAKAQEYILPKSFIYHQKDTLTWLGLPKNEALAYPLIEKLVFFEGGKKKPSTLNTLAQIHKVVDSRGLMLVGFQYVVADLPQQTSDLVAYFETHNFLFMADTLKKSLQSQASHFKLHSFQKILFLSDRGFGNLHQQKIGHDLEIVLLQNPYFALYGEDITGILLYKGIPMPYASVKVSNLNSAFEKSENVILSTDEEGRFYFKTNRLGVWMLESYYWDAKNQSQSISHAMYNFEFVK